MARAPLSADIEALPEADRLEGFAHPRETLELFGQSKAEQVLSDAIASGKMHHAWLMTGAEGIGKATLCYRAARALLARDDERGMFASGLDVDAASTTARQILARSNRGLTVIRRPHDT